MQVKKKWETWSSKVKGKESIRRREFKKTGGGKPPESLTVTEEKVVNLLGETAIEGIANAIDTSSVVIGTPVKEVHVTEGEETEFAKSTEKSQDMEELQRKKTRKGEWKSE